MKKPNNKDRLKHILDAIEKIELYLTGFEKNTFQSDSRTQDAVIRQLSIVGEATNCLTRDLRAKYPQVEWRFAAATRNRLIHGYFDVDAEIVWDTAENDIPKLKAEITKILEKLNEEEN